MQMFGSRVALGFAAALGLAVMAADAQAAATVSAGVDSGATLTGAVRYRNFGGSGTGGAAEIQVGDGVNAAGVTNAASGQIAWGGSTQIKITYGSSILKTEVGSGPVVVQKLLNPPPSLLNYLQITVVKNQTSTSVSLNNVILAGQSLGNFALGVGNSGTADWNATGINLQSGFTLTGTLVLATGAGPGGSGSFGGGDSSRVQIAVGSVTPPDIEAPIVSDVVVEPKPVLLNGEATVTANVDDSTTGGNNIASAAYGVDGGAWTSMDAADGAFDGVSEGVEATFTAAEVGTHEVCVRGTDSAVPANTSDGEDCEEFLVDYKFAGFYSPVDNYPVVNAAKAGQGVPVKWRLTDANDVPISDPVSFTGGNGGLYSYLVSCSTFQGDVADSIEEYAAGSSGLQYTGDGYWQFNWKTPKTYANTCRAMYVQFDSGGASPTALFQFR
jgi:hypothetical protein